MVELADAEPFRAEVFENAPSQVELRKTGPTGEERSKVELFSVELTKDVLLILPLAIPVTFRAVVDLADVVLFLSNPTPVEKDPVGSGIWLVGRAAPVGTTFDEYPALPNARILLFRNDESVWLLVLFLPSLCVAKGLPLLSTSTPDDGAYPERGI